MVRRAQSSFGTGERTAEFELECIFQVRNHAGDAICVRDGQTRKNALGREELVDTWIDVDKITDQDFDSINDLHRGEKIIIFIPEWYANKKGVI